MISEEDIRDHIEEFTIWPRQAYFAVGISHTTEDHNEIYHFYRLEAQTNLAYNRHFFPHNLHRLLLRIIIANHTVTIRLGGSFTLCFHMHWNYDLNRAVFDHYIWDILGLDRDN